MITVSRPSPNTALSNFLNRGVTLTGRRHHLRPGDPPLTTPHAQMPNSRILPQMRSNRFADVGRVAEASRPRRARTFAATQNLEGDLPY